MALKSVLNLLYCIYLHNFPSKILKFIDDALFQDMWRGSLHHSSSQTLDYMAKELTYTGNFLLSLFKLKWFMYSAL